jgi:hypothetical protein
MAAPSHSASRFPPAGGPGNGFTSGSNSGDDGHPSRGTPFALGATLWALGVLIAVVICVGAGIGLSAAINAYDRAEKRANANNDVALTRIAIRRAQQQSLVAAADVGAAQANAEARYTEAVGIRRAEDLIAAGKLTGAYLQYLAIQAQQAVATSGRNNTLIYLPSGNGGVPLVQDVARPNAATAP